MVIIHGGIVVLRSLLHKFVFSRILEDYRVLKISFALKTFVFPTRHRYIPNMQNKLNQNESYFFCNIKKYHQRPILFTINASYLSVYSSSPWFKRIKKQCSVALSKVSRAPH